MSWNVRILLVCAAMGSLVSPCLAKEPTADDLFRQGNDAAARHETDKAILLMQKVIQVRPRALNAYVNLATYYGRDKHDLRKAESIIKKALIISPDDFTCQYEYAQILIEQGKYEQAKRALSNASPKTQSERLKRDRNLKEVADAIAESKN